MQYMGVSTSKTVSLTANSCVALSTARGLKKLDMRNEHASGAARVIFANNLSLTPWALSMDAGDHVTINGVAGDSNYLASTTGVVKARFKVTTSVSNKTIYSISDYSASNEYFRIYVTAANKLAVSLRNATAEQWNILVDTALVDDTWYVVKVIQNGVTPIVYIDHNKWPQTLTATTDQTAWISSLTTANIDVARIGSLAISSAEAQQFLGTIDFLQIVRGLPSDVLAGYAEVAQYRMKDGAGTTVTDETGSYDGTFGGGAAAPTWAINDDGMLIDAGEGYTWDTDLPNQTSYGYTTVAGVTMTVTEGR